MKKLSDQLEQLNYLLSENKDSKKPPSKKELSYKERRELYAKQANHDIKLAQIENRNKRIEILHGASELNPLWTFENLDEDSEDAKEAIKIASAFISALGDPNRRSKSPHLMLFYGDYGRGKSHIAGAIANHLIQQHEVTVLYRQLQSLLELRFFSFDFSTEDDTTFAFRELSKQLQQAELLILDEVCVNQTNLKPSAQSWLGNLLRHRALHNKNCILITNHNLQQLSQALGSYCYESIKEYQTYNVHFEGPSRRESLPDDASLTTTYHPNKPT